MTSYKNISQKSGVLNYEIGSDSITVEFKDEKLRHYKYTHVKPGVDIVNEMKRLAIQGYGLGTYISQTVKENYDKKW